MQRRVLLVEDGSYNRNAVRRVLMGYDLDFLEAENGEEALAILASEPVDLVLLDLSMPVMDGYGFLQHFRANPAWQRIPVCVMTGWSDSERRRRAADLGADDFVLKPMDSTELQIRVQAMLRMSDYQRELAEMKARLDALEAKLDRD